MKASTSNIQQRVSRAVSARFRGDTSKIRRGEPRLAFTLVELLVVVTIIVVLMAMLAPKLDEAVRLAVRASCTARVHGLQSGWFMYTQDNNKKLVGASTGGAWDWVGNDIRGDGSAAAQTAQVNAITKTVFYPYAPGLKVYKCPADSLIPRMHSFSMSNFVNGLTGWGINPVSKLTSISRFSDTMVFLEEDDPRPEAYNWGAWVVYPRGHAKQEQWIDYPANYHKDGNVHSFADGHAIYRPFEDDRTGEIKTFEQLSPDNDDLRYYQKIYNTDGQ